MTVDAATTADGLGSDLARRLARYRAANGTAGRPSDELPHRPIRSADLAQRLAETLGGEVVATPTGRYVRIDGPTTDIPVDRARLAGLPGMAPAGRPLVCLDTETTGLATATGTVAFLIGLGWWEGDRFRQVQLVLPDHADEPAMLEAFARHVPQDAWLVSYNGRGFDWPLLVTRFRLARRDAPAHEGHLDLLPVVRRVFRHRMTDARLGTVERMLLDVTRHDDVDGWEIPGRYLGFLRGGPAHVLAAVVRHNDEDVRSLARLIGLLDVGYADHDARRTAPAGDLAGLARAYARARRPEEALACLEIALDRIDAAPSEPLEDPSSARPTASAASPVAEANPPAPWWSPKARPDFGGRPRIAADRHLGPDRRVAVTAPWDAQRIGMDRAHLLRRLGRWDEAVEAWSGLAAGPGRVALIAWIELAKLYEHRLLRPDAALVAARRGLTAVERRRRLGLPERALEADLSKRATRLQARLSRPGRPRSAGASGGRAPGPAGP